MNTAICDRCLSCRDRILQGRPFHYTGVSVESLRKLRPALVLSAGFGGLVLFILAAAIGTLVLLDRVRADDTRIRQAFLGRLRTLEQIRSQIYLSGTDMRDFLLSPGEGGVEATRKDIVGIETQ